MEIDSDKDKVDGDKAFELEDASTTTEEAPTHVATTSVDSVLRQKLLYLPAPKVSLARTGVKSVRIEQMFLLVNVDARRLMKKSENKHGFHTHEFKHCGMLINLQWKVNGFS